MSIESKNSHQVGNVSDLIDGDLEVVDDFEVSPIKTLVSKSQRSSILVVENSETQIWVQTTLRSSKIKFDLVTNLQQAYELERGLLNYKWVVINPSELARNFSPLPQAIHRYSKSVSLIVVGVDRDREFERLFLADVSTHWIEVKSKNSQSILVQLILEN